MCGLFLFGSCIQQWKFSNQHDLSYKQKQPHPSSSSSSQQSFTLFVISSASWLSVLYFGSDHAQTLLNTGDAVFW